MEVQEAVNLKVSGRGEPHLQTFEHHIIFEGKTSLRLFNEAIFNIFSKRLQFLRSLIYSFTCAHFYPLKLLSMFQPYHSKFYMYHTLNSYNKKLKIYLFLSVISVCNLLKRLSVFCCNFFGFRMEN